MRVYRGGGHDLYDDVATVTDYAADDVVQIKRRMAEIAAESRGPVNTELATALDKDLEFIARDYGLYRVDGESDYALTKRIADYKKSKKIA